LHHEVDKGQELLELAELVVGLFFFLEVEPTFTNSFKGGLNDALEFVNPALFARGVLDRRDSANLVLLEFFNAHSLLCAYVENLAVAVDDVALFTDLNHRLDDFILDEERVEAELGELFREIMGRNVNLTEVGDLLWGSRLRKAQVGRDHVLVSRIRVSLLLHGLLHNDKVHCALEVHGYLVHERVVVRIALL